MIRHFEKVRGLSRRRIATHEVVFDLLDAAMAVSLGTRPTLVERCDSCGRVVVRGVGAWWEGKR